MLMPVAKSKMINVRLSEQTHNDFKVACELKGAGMAQILHQFIVKTIREEKELEPQAFREKPTVVNANEKPYLKLKTS